MADGTTLTKHAYTRRKMLAFSATGAAAAVLAACGAEGGVPTSTPAPTTAASAAAATRPAGPTVTPTAIPQTFGAAATTAPTTAATSAATGAMAAAASPAAMATPVAAASPAAATPAAMMPAANLAQNQVFRWADANPPDGIDPAIITSPYMVSQIFEGLLVVSPRDGMFEPGMAESYASNADATVWTFKMRPGVTWSDGTAITAKDFEFSFRRVMDPATKSKYTSALYVIKNGKEVETGKVPPDQLGVRAVDDRTFEVTLSEPTPFFPLIAGTWTCLPTPKHVIDAKKEQWTFGPNVVSNGPYVLREWRRDQSFSYERNDRYWGAKPTITRVEQRILDDPRAGSLRAYEANELDQAILAPGDLDRVRNDARLKNELKPFEGSSTHFLVVDCTNRPTDDVRVRQALALAYDRKAMIDTVLRGLFTDAPTMLPDNISGFNLRAAIPGDMARAKMLMAEAGFPNGQNWPADFTLEHSTAAATTHKVALEFLQSQWKMNLGIDVKVQAYDPATYTNRRRMRQMGMKFNIAFGNWGSDYADPSNWHNQLFVSRSDYYGSHYKNEMFDTLAARAFALNNKEERVRLYEQAEEVFVRDASHITIYHGREFYVIKPNVQGIYHPPILGTTPWFKYISITR